MCSGLSINIFPANEGGDAVLMADWGAGGVNVYLFRRF